MPGDSGVTVVTNARAFYTTRAAAGASGARHSLRPLIFRERDVNGKTRAHTRRDREVVAAMMRWLKIEVALTSPRLRGEVGDAAQRRLRVKGTIRESEPAESPPHPLERCSRPLPAS